MIFKSIFTPAYKSNDADKRQQSIAKLDKNKEKDKAILHELAFNDDNDNVMLSALDKLDSFILWIKALETTHSERIKKRAQKVCIEQLESSERVNDSLFTSFIEESKNKAVLEQLLFNSERLLTQNDLALALLFEFDNEVFTKRFFQEKANEEQQQKIIEKIADTKTLNRFAKLSKHSSVRAKIDDKLGHLQFLQEKPKKIEQQVTLINARLLALKDAQDYAYLRNNFTKLCDEFEQVKADFHYLHEETAATHSEKYLALKSSLQRKLDDREAQYKEQLKLNQTSDDLSEIANKVRLMQQQIDLLLQQISIDEAQSVDAELKILATSVNDAQDELVAIKPNAQTAAHTQTIKQLASQLNKMQNILVQLPELMLDIKSASKIISDAETAVSARESESAGSTENNAEQAKSTVSESEQIEWLDNKIKQAKSAFDNINAVKQGNMPTSLIDKFRAALKLLSTKKNSLIEAKKKREYKIESKLKIVNRLIREGKYTPAIGTFFQLKNSFVGLAESASARLTKSYQQTLTEIEKLQDWQAYIAQPRKPALIEQVKSMLAAGFEDPYERAEQVKQYRKEWTSYGSLHTPEDDAHNKTFDDLIETAFAPVRAFFAELERQREHNLSKAITIIEEAKKIDLSQPAQALAKEVGVLKTRFSEVGELDKNKINKVKRDFSKALKPLNERIREAQKENAELKLKLIQKAQSLVENLKDNSEFKEAANQAKQLQQKWKEVGFAGKSVDNRLWQKFREINDSLFSRYHENLSVQKSAQEEQLQEIDKKVTEVLDKIQAASQISELQFYEKTHTELAKELLDVDEHTRKKVMPKLSKMEETFDRSVKQMQREKEQLSVKALFDFLAEFNSSDAIDSMSELPSRYQTWIKGEFEPVRILAGLNRDELAMVAAILHDIPFATLKFGKETKYKELQLQLMAEKLQSGETVLPELVLAAFVGQGPISEEQQQSVDAMQSMFLKNTKNA